MPRYSIILPVRNGGEYIKSCVSSILAQTLKDFDLLILDNKSTDGTTEWITTLNDPRIKIFPAGRSLTIEENWGRVVSLPKNEFMTLIGHDDVLASDYLETMTGLIQQHSSASLYQTHFDYISAEGERIRLCHPMAEVQSAPGFLETFLKKQIDVMGTGFMMRSKDYDELGGIPPYPNLLFADFELWINLAAKNYKATSPKHGFSFRIHQSMTTSSADTKYHQAFGRFMEFLTKLSSTGAEYKSIIREHAASYLLFYCQGLSHRLLRTPKENREGLTVDQFIGQCRNYAAALGIYDQFKPEKKFSITLAKQIDKHAFTRSLFLRFKKLYPKPLMK